MADDKDHEYEAMAAALAEGASVEFGTEKDDPEWAAPVMLQQRGGTFIAKRLDGSTLSVFGIRNT